MSITDCEAGNHTKEAVLESAGVGSIRVVRWCSVCGSMWLDMDYVTNSGIETQPIDDIRIAEIATTVSG